MTSREDTNERQIARLKLLKGLYHTVGYEWESKYGDRDLEDEFPPFPTILGRLEAEGRVTEEELEMARKMAGLPEP